MKILMVVSECVPFVKVGGLADVAGALPRALKARGHDVRIIMPKYQAIDSQKFNLKSLPLRLEIPIGKNIEEATVKEGRLDGVPVYFIESARYFYRPGVYRSAEGDYGDNRERYVFFSRAALETAKAILFQPDIVHCHDWQTGIIPAYIKTAYRTDGFYFKTRSVYTIHNIAYQGIFERDTIDVAGLPWSEYTWDKLEFFGFFNFMKAGIVYADAVSTVSPTYAKEIQTEDGGRSMEKALASRSASLAGILNGIDYGEWSPSKDAFIAAKFSKADPSGKALCKEDLQRTCGLPVRPGSMLVGSVSRIDPQKGYDLAAKVMAQMTGYDVQFVVLGAGDRNIQDMLTGLRRQNPEKISLNFKFDNALAHKIYAGADAFLMPSRFEPCGLGQMIAMAYGTAPVVTKTGGLADSVEQFNGNDGTGFVAQEIREQELKASLEMALNTYLNKAAWEKLMQNCFSADFTWDRSVPEYEEMYAKALAGVRYRNL